MVDFAFRRVEIESDVPRLLALIAACEAVDQVGEQFSEADLRDELAWPEDDARQDRWVVPDPGDPDRIIASGVLWKSVVVPHGRVGVRVHPAWRRQGLGGALLARSLDAARAQQASVVKSGADDRLTGRAAFLGKHGFTPEAQWVDMRAPATTALPEPVLPTGYTIRTHANLQDPALLVETLNAGFCDYYDFRESTPAEMGHWLARESVAADGLFVAFGPDGDPAGICLTEANPTRRDEAGQPVGFIDSLGVVPAHRRRGLARALLLTGMHWLRAHGQGAIDLDTWGHNDRALPLYTGVGFAVTRRGTLYRRET
jgi:mycothiol synthase